MTMMTTMTLRRHLIPRAAHTLALCALLLSLAWSLGCSKEPKPRELAELEVMWQDPETRKVKDVPGAGAYYQAAYQFRQRAAQAYNDGDIDQAREYAIWSLLKYRTAQAVAQQSESKDRLEAANVKLAKLNPEIVAANQERNKLVAQVGELERQLAVAKRRKADDERRLNAMNQVGKGDDSAARERERAQAIDLKLDEIERARQEAIDVNAPKHAAATYNRAENVLKSLRLMRQTSPLPYETMVDSAEIALKSFQQARMESKPGYKEQVAKSDPVARREGLQREAAAILGAPYALAEGATVRVIATRSFAPASTQVNENGQRNLKAIIELAAKYDELNLSIEVYTSKGDATENLATSQLRARRVEELFTSSGVSKKRITQARGLGQENLRYPEDVSLNERVEVIFSSP